jgi:predicted secreted protein
MVGDLGLLSGSCIVTRLAYKGKFENRLYFQVRRSGNDADRRYRKAE